MRRQQGRQGQLGPSLGTTATPPCRLAVVPYGQRPAFCPPDIVSALTRTTSDCFLTETFDQNNFLRHTALHAVLHPQQTPNPSKPHAAPTIEVMSGAQHPASSLFAPNRCLVTQRAYRHSASWLGRGQERKKSRKRRGWTQAGGSCSDVENRCNTAIINTANPRCPT